MKLLACHVDGFGTFHDLDLSFDEGLNVFLQPNGWGKTTLAAFVKAMLYGFEDRRVRDVAHNERLRYAPWQGGTYGGSLDFEALGRSYRVMCTFGRTRSQDKVRVVDLDTGRPVSLGAGQSVGEWLFGLDAGSFQKSVYVVGNGFGFDGSTTGLRNRLNALVNETDDVAGFDKAQAQLDKRRKHYERTGGRGAIADATREIAKLVEQESKARQEVAQAEEDGRELARLDGEVADLDRRIAEAQDRAQEELAERQRLDALLQVGKGLEGRQRSTREAYERELGQDGGSAPSDEDVDRAQALAADVERLGHDAQTFREADRAAENRERRLAEAYPGGLPTREDLAERKAQLGQLVSGESALAQARLASGAGEGQAWGGGSPDDDSAERAEAVLARLDEVMATVRSGQDAQSRLDTLKARWDEQVAQVRELADEAERLRGAAEGDSEDAAAALRDDARALREAERRSAGLEARRDLAQTRLAAERDALAGLPEPVPDEEIDELEHAAREAVAAEDAVAEAVAAHREAKAGLTRRMQEKVSQPGKESGTTGSGDGAARPTPVAMAALLAGAAILAVVGVVVGPSGALSLALYAVAAVVAVAGLAVGRRSRVRTDAGARGTPDFPGPIEGSGEADAVREAAARAARVAEDAGTRARQAEERLRAAAERALPGEGPSAKEVLSAIPLLRQRVSVYQAQAQRVDAAEDELVRASSELDKARSDAGEVLVRNGCAPDEDVSDAAGSIEARASSMEERMRAAGEARLALRRAASGLAGRKVASDAELADVLGGLGSSEPPEAPALREEARQGEAAAQEYAARLTGLLRAFGEEGVPPSRIDAGAERLSRAVGTYRQQAERTAAAEQERSRQERELSSQRSSLEAWAASMGASSLEGLDEAWFATAEADVAASEHLEWERQQAQDGERDALQRAGHARRELGDLLGSHGIDGTDADAGLAELVRRRDRARELARAAAAADRELSHWREQNGEALAHAQRQGNSAAVVGGAEASLNMLRSRRDDAVRERAQLEEHRRALLDSLEGLPALRQRVRLLSKGRQASMTSLFTVRRTAELLKSAREGLDARYLGDLGDRFADYATALLADEGLGAVVDDEFDVQVVEGDLAHDVAAYSSGYQALLDICFRLALVDTLFQAERPFLILDDPFASLDEEKLRSCLALVSRLAEGYQVVYLTCHPSRLAEGGGGAPTDFVMPERRPRRELPRARARREAEERAKEQERLVASYEVVSVAPGKAGIVPAPGRRLVSTNLVSVSFVVDDSQGTGDNSFEVHFIDERGRSLCDRQSVQVMDGQVVPDRVRLSLETRDDSGRTFELVIHEDGRAESELAGRIPYRSEIAFASSDFGF